MNEHYTLDNLTQSGVSVKRQTFIEYQGQQYPIGDAWRRAYANSPNGRQQVVDELPQSQVNAILAVWGDAPVITDESKLV
ncbi:hypothetical protein [Metasolibacillus meyeri]|uniref:hypothetical protein n=1 Tax=Metasolibacillus meyeri TaxID=1071052 RepID=UPI000D300B81|nr:hypothetical protein [Metasolibacillus meyeri]